MFKLLNKKKNNKGFTLVELVIVIAILAILVGLLAPQYTKYVEKSRQTADIDNMEEMVKAVQVYAVENGANNKLTDTTATITLTSTGVTFGNDTVAKAVAEYVPDYAKIAKKSQKWSKDPYVNIKIDTDGGVTADYQPGDFATAAGRNTVTPTPAKP